MGNMLWDELYQEDPGPEPTQADCDEAYKAVEAAFGCIPGKDGAGTKVNSVNEAIDLGIEIDRDYPEDPHARYVETEPKKAGPVVNKRKREGIALCKVYDPAKPPKWDAVIFEPKFDGYRCIARVKDGKAELLTSTGLPHWNVYHIIRQLEEAAKDKPLSCDNIVLDGELLHEDLPFDIAGGILRKHDPDLRALGFYLMAWDCLPVAEFDAKTCSRELTYRKADLEMALERIKDYGEKNYVYGVEYVDGTIDQIESHARTFVGEGNEGIIAKNAGGFYNYKGKSGECWLKWKPTFEDGEAKDMKDGDVRITDATAGRGKHQGRAGALVYKGYLQEDGNISPDPVEGGLNKEVLGKGGTGLSDAQREQFWQWKQQGVLAGHCAEIRYQELSSKGKLRFPVFYRLREDKD